MCTYLLLEPALKLYREKLLGYYRCKKNLVLFGQELHALGGLSYDNQIMLLIYHRPAPVLCTACEVRPAVLSKLLKRYAHL